MLRVPVRLDEVTADDLRVAIAETRRIARNGILPFTAYTKPDYRINWHHRLIASKLDQFVKGEIKRLIIAAPPQAGGKSELVSRRLPPYILGKHPKANVIGASYSSDLIETMSRTCQRIMSQDEYRELFPSVRVGTKGLKSADTDWETSEGGTYRCAGVGGGINGKPGDFALLDDLIKGRTEANSPTVRKRTWDWLNDDLLTRLGAHGSCLLMATRWHEEDPTGMILSIMENDPEAEKWETLIIPARLDSEEDRVPGDPRELGEPMWPWYYAGKRNDIGPDEQMERAKAFLSRWEKANPLGFASLAQQQPTPLSGDKFSRDWFNIIPRDQVPKGMRLVRYWDFAGTTPTPKNPNPDWTAGALCGEHEGCLYILDMVHFRGDSDVNERKVRETAESDGYDVEIIIELEGGSSGKHSFSTYQTRILKGFSVRSDRPTGDKVLRSNAWSSLAKNGKVFLVKGHWNAPFIAEAVTFPNGKKDQIDSVSGGYKELFQTSSLEWADIDI